jgi:hypothetical protein
MARKARLEKDDRLPRFSEPAHERIRAPPLEDSGIMFA